MEIGENIANGFFEKAMAAVADPYRMRIIRKIRERGVMRCCDIVELTGLSQPTCSHHIKLLADSELIECRKEGRSNYITLHKENFKKLGKFIEQFSEA
ncbi:MAG TPA: metalloregulator ArsR/SmtB family transcription factor [Ferruginibacter sp.]|nr:metalloregulator ArsR/SmtB family transcription factor [Ferruginibacter sp.]